MSRGGIGSPVLASVIGYTCGNGPWHAWGDRKRNTGVGINRPVIINPETDNLLSIFASQLLIGQNERPSRTTSTHYSDRLYQFDDEKHDRLARLHFGDQSQNWSGRSAESVQAFLRDYHGRPALTLIAVWQGNNASSGFPYWSFWTHD